MSQPRGALVARYAGRAAEGFICTSGKKPELYTETLLPKVAEGIAASEDPSRPYDRMIEVKVSFDTDKTRALEDTRHWAALALTPEEKMTVEDPVEMQRLADALPLERAASRWIVSSDADEQVERIGYYVGLGFRNLVFHAPGPDQARFLKLYGEHVLPRLRKRFGWVKRDRPMNRSTAVEILAVPGVPLVCKDDDLVDLIGEGLARGGIVPRGGDVFVLTQKIVSKAEGRMVDLATVKPSTEAIELAGKVQKDPRLVELILSESVRVVRTRPGVLIVEHRLGLVMANAGIDQSNVGSSDDPQRALLLPVDPDGSAVMLRKQLWQRFGVPIAVIISDSFGRAWRRGTCGVAIGAAGLPSLMDLRGSPDLYGRELQVSVTGHTDEIAAAASLVMGQGAEGQPVVIVRGLTWRGPDNAASELVRPAAEDLFR